MGDFFLTDFGDALGRRLGYARPVDAANDSTGACWHVTHSNIHRPPSISRTTRLIAAPFRPDADGCQYR